MKKIVDGVVFDCTPDEIAEVEALQANAEAFKHSREGVVVRNKRDSLLQDTDWIVIKSYERGANIPAEWELYRQALRDITAQGGFPYAVIWPNKP